MIRYLLATLVSLFLLATLFPNITYANLLVLVIAAVVLAICQVVVKPILSLLLLPITIITLGFFGSVVNVAVLWLVTAVVPGFHIDPVLIAGHHLGFFMTLILVSFLISLLQRLFLTILERV